MLLPWSVPRHQWDVTLLKLKRWSQYSLKTFHYPENSTPKTRIIFPSHTLNTQGWDRIPTIPSPNEKSSGKSPGRGVTGPKEFGNPAEQTCTISPLLQEKRVCLGWVLTVPRSGSPLQWSPWLLGHTFFSITLQLHMKPWAMKAADSCPRESGRT